jgi:HlyD family secretion protein
MSRFSLNLRRFLITVVLAAAAWFGYDAFMNRPPEVVEYRTSPVTRTPIIHAVTATGELKALVLVEIGSQLSGTITAMLADFNDKVKAGDVLVRLDPATYTASLQQNEGELANAEAELKLAQLNAERKKQLREKELAPVADYDKAMATLAQAEANVKIRTASLRKAQVDLERCTIYAPIDGIVISRKVDVGQTVASSFNSPVLFEIAKDLSVMEIHANVSEADIGGVEEGQEVDFTVDAFPDRTFHGKVKQVRNAPTTVDNVVTYVTVIAADNKDLKLKPGMTANVAVILAKRDMALAVPNSALRFQPEPAAPTAPVGSPGDGPSGEGRRQRAGAAGKRGTGPPVRTVYVIDTPGSKTKSATLKALTLTTGITDGTRTEVLSGVEEGLEVVTGIIAKESPPAAAGGSSPFGGSSFRR